MSNKVKIKPKKAYECCGTCVNRQKHGICGITHVSVWKFDKPCVKYQKLFVI